MKKKKNYFLKIKNYYFLISIIICFFVFSFIILKINEEDYLNYPFLPIYFSKNNPSVFLEDFSSLRNNLISEKKNFLEINFPQSKVKTYKEGLLYKEFPILMRGDPYNWGGSAAGLYEAIAKYRAAYSLTAEVYMPYSVHYWGKYYIHGEPYYPDGDRFYSDASGGCIQIKNEDAREIYEFSQRGMPVLSIDKENDDFRYPSKRTTKFPKLSAKNYLIADLDSGFVFSEKDSQKRVPIASLTKLMTAAVVSEEIDLRKSITVSTAMLEPYGETEGLSAGKEFSIVNLFYPLLTESSNDAAEVLSYFLGRKRAVELMNKKAKSIMMNDTDFADVHGYGPENISSARDIFYLVRYVLNNRPLIWDITKGKEVISYGDITFKNLENRNLFYSDPDFAGGKTGYIISSKYVGAFIFKLKYNNEKERKAAIIILGSDNLKTGENSLEKETIKVLDWLKKNYF